MADVDDFIAHPRTFLRSHVLMVIGDTEVAGGVRRFTFAKATGLTARDMTKDGNPAMEVFSLRPDTGSGDRVDIYWCPFNSGNWLGTTLPGAGGPNVMFTYAMDGCTFVAGSRTGGGDVRVHHVNMANAGFSGLTGPGAAQQQYKMQRGVAKGLVTNPALIDPDDYYNPATRAVPIPDGAKISTVTFGRRATGGWKFYVHQFYTVPGDRMTLRFIGTERVI